MFLGNSSVNRKEMPPRLPSSAADFVVPTFSVSSPVAMRMTLKGALVTSAGRFSPGALGIIALRKYRALRQLTDCPLHLRRNGVQVL
jgi:hypothetical protein